MGNRRLVLEETAKIAKHCLWIVQLAPRDAYDPPARGLQATVSFAVGLERDASSVRFSAVELSDYALLPPEAVGFDFSLFQLEQDVEFWPGKDGTGEQGSKPFLELAPSPAG